jgi:hypothetical protein
VTVRVVDLPEVVEVEEHHGETHLVPAQIRTSAVRRSVSTCDCIAA